MSLYRNLVRYCVFPVFSRLYNRHYAEFARLWDESQTWSAERLEEHRWQRFRSVLDHAANTVPFYRDFFRERGLSVDDFKDFGDIEKLPVLSKTDYQDEGIERFVSEVAAPRDRIRESTSGTSGRPFAFFIDPPLVASKMARLIRENRWADWEPGDLYFRLWGPHEESLSKRIFYDGVMRRRVISAFTLERDFDEVVARFEQERPGIIEAYTSGAVHLARLCRDRGVTLPSPRSIVVSAETLTQSHRELIEQHIGGRVFNRYGSREFGNVAQECERGGFHIHSESFHVEAEEHAEIDGARNLVITNFDNYTMPFLRYRIGDLGTLSDETCSCGRSLPLLGGVQGRSTDFFALSNGGLLSFLYFNYYFEQYGGLIDAYQVAQIDRDDFEVRILPGPSYSDEVPEKILAGLDEQYGGSPRFEVRATELVRESSGKLRTYVPLR